MTQMTKPEDIPQRVWDEAQRLFNQIDQEGAMPRDPMPDLARAILSAEQRERDACAQVAKIIRSEVLAAHQHERAYVAECIETAIRNRKDTP